MCSVPRRVATAGAIVMAEHRATRRRVARPVFAIRVGRSWQRSTLRVRARQDVVGVRRVAHSIHRQALLGDRVHLVDLIAVADDVAVKIGDVRRDHDALRVVPRTRANSIACMDRPSAGVRRAKVGTPCAPRRELCPRRLRQRVAMRVRASQTAQVRAVTLPDARDEE